MFENEHRLLNETDFFPEASAGREQGSRNIGGVLEEVQRSPNTSTHIIVRRLV